MYLIIMEGNYGDINVDNSTCRGYYNIRFSSFPYTLKADLSIYGQIISSGEMLFEGTNSLNQYQFSLLYFSENKSNNTILYLRKIIYWKF